MQLAVGNIVEGKVTGITKFGAFVELPGRQNRDGTYFRSGTDLCQRDPRPRD